MMHDLAFRRRPDQARASRRSDPPPARTLCARRPAALRAGQMVSRRKPAALGVRALLAQGRRADLEEFRSDRQRSKARARPRSKMPSVSPKAPRRSSGVDSELHPAGVRGSRPLAAEGSRPAGQCRSQRFQIVRSGESARAWRGCSITGSTCPRVSCCRSSAGTRAGNRRAGAASAGNCGAAICS